MKENNKRIYIFLFVFIGILWAIPSIIYLITNNSIDGYNGTLYYFLNGNSLISTVLGVFIYALLLIVSFLLYFKLIKNVKNLSIKNILLLVLIIGFSFLIAFPNTSTDVFYYMGTGRVLEEYGQNPYYMTIGNLLESNSDDIILRNSGPWKFTTIIYGPVWVIVSFIFNKICFNSITLLLYIFKIAALLLHIANCYIIYKITKKKIFSILYGFNPLVLMEFLINAHNDIYLIFFVLLAIYFLKNKKNIWCSLLMLAISVGIKYVTLLLVPIFVLYYLRNKKIIEKFKLILIYAIFFILLIYIMYLPFINNALDIFKIITNQQNKIKDSIYLFFFVITNRNSLVVSIIYSIMFFVVGYYYIIFCLKLLFRESNFSMLMKNTNILLAIIIFGVLTNLTSWYLTWFFISIYWLRSKDIKLILAIQFLYEFTYTYLYFWHNDNYMNCFIIIPTIVIGLMIRLVYLNINNKKVYI